MKRQNFRASSGRGSWIQTRITSRERYNESSSFSNNLWNVKAREGGGLGSDKDYESGMVQRIVFFSLII